MVSDGTDDKGDPESVQDDAPLMPGSEAPTTRIPMVQPPDADAATQQIPVARAEGPKHAGPSAPPPPPSSGPPPEPAEQPEPTEQYQPAEQPEPAATASRPRWVTAAAVVGGVLAILAVLYVADLVISSGNVPRGVTVAGIGVGGRSAQDAEAALRAQLGSRVDQPIAVTAGDVNAEIVPSAAGLNVDWAQTLAHAGSQPINPITRITSFFTEREIDIASTRDDAALAAAIDQLRATTDRQPREGNVVFDGVTPVPVEPLPGQTLDTKAAADIFAAQWWASDHIDLPVQTQPVSVTPAAVDRTMREIATPAAATDLVVEGQNGAVATLPRDRIGTVLTFSPDGAGGLTPHYNTDAAIGILAPQLASTEVKPQDAKVVLSGGSPTVVPSVTGKLVQWPKTLEKLPELLSTPGAHATAAVYEPIPPTLSTEAANGLGIREVIGEFTTGGFEYASGVNIRLAAGAINGAVLKPGETFSLNGYTGPRGTAQGYIESGIINNGRPDKAVGGGISQLATTLYNASYFAGMEDVEHTEHSYYISRYPAAREATVFEGAIDLKFRNPASTGVLIQAFGTDSEVTVRIWGTKTVNVQSITGERSKPTSPNTIVLPAGEHCVASSGAPGFTVSDTRVITDAASGQQISRNTRTVKYDPVPIVKCQ